jgi:hypothetical protein
MIRNIAFWVLVGIISMGLCGESNYNNDKKRTMENQIRAINDNGGWMIFKLKGFVVVQPAEAFIDKDGNATGVVEKELVADNVSFKKEPYALVDCYIERYDSLDKAKQAVAGKTGRREIKNVLLKLSELNSSTLLE